MTKKFDYEKIKDKYIDSLSKYNFKNVFDNPNHGTLNFKDIQSEFEKFYDFIFELELLNYRENLYQQEVNQVDSARNRLTTAFNQVQQFDIAQPNATSVRESIINNLKSLIFSESGPLDGILTKLQSKKFLRSSDTGAEVKKIQSTLIEIEKQKNNLDLLVEEQKKLLKKQEEEFAQKITELDKRGLSTAEKSQSFAIGEIHQFFDKQANIHQLNSDGEKVSLNWFKSLFNENGWLRRRSRAIF